jgi:hypothetical protein
MHLQTRRDKAVHGSRQHGMSVAQRLPGTAAALQALLLRPIGTAKKKSSIHSCSGTSSTHTAAGPTPCVTYGSNQPFRQQLHKAYSLAEHGHEVVVVTNQHRAEV